MKKLFLIASIVTLVLLITACTLEGYTGTFYLLSPNPEDGTKKIGCEEYLVPITEEFADDPTTNKLATVLKGLLNSDPSKYESDYLTATAFKDKYIQLESVDNSTETIQVRFNSDPSKGIAGVCDVPRIKEQITETIRMNAEATPFKIYLDGSESKWKCLGDQSGMCQ